jgi:signal transduction histidine kinase
MLQHARTSTGTKEPINLNTLADECLRLSYHGIRAKDKLVNVTLHNNFDPNLPLVPLVQEDISRVLINIINNAVYAVMQKKKKAGEGYTPTVSITTSLQDSYAKVAISDNGIGIPQQVFDKIFQPFFTTKPTGEGTGLGLSMSYDIITKGHGGKLEVTSEDGEGATFTILLPM